MSSSALRSPLHVDGHTWVTMLFIGVGFLLVSATAQFTAGNPWHALDDLLSAGVFLHTARVLQQQAAGPARRIAVLANVALVAVRVADACHEMLTLRAAYPDHDGPALFAVIAMSAVLQLSVIVMALESLRRLAQGVSAGR